MRRMGGGWHGGCAGTTPEPASMANGGILMH